MGLAPLGRDGSALPGPANLRRAAERAPPPAKKICSPQAFSREHRGQRRGEAMRRSLLRGKGEVPVETDGELWT